MGKRKRDTPKQRKPSPDPAFLEGSYATGLLIAILFLALLLRVAALKGIDASIYSDIPIMDEQFYHVWASRIADGTFSNEATYRSAPLPAYLMAFIYKLFSPDISHIRIFHVILGVLTCWLIYQIGRRLGDRITGLSACLVAALYEPFIFYSAVPLNTMQSVCLFAITTLFFLKTIEGVSGLPGIPPPAQRSGSVSSGENADKSFLNAILLGLAAGLLIETRGNAVILIPVIPAALFFFAHKAKTPLRKLSAVIGVFALGFSIAVAPFCVRNYMATGHFSLSSAQTGFALYTGNNLDNPDPYYRPVPFASSIPSEQLVQMTIEASRRAGRKLSNQEASSFWRAEIMKTAAERPAAFLKKTGEKFLVLFNRFEAGDHYDLDFMKSIIPFFKFPFLAFALILPFGMAGMMTSFGKSHKASGAVLFFVFYGATLVLFFTSDRLRLPLLVLLIPFAVLGIQRFVRLMKVRSERKTLFVAAVAVVAMVEFLPLRATHDMTCYYNTHANVLLSRGFGAEAVSYWKRSSQMNGSYSAFADLSLAGIFAQKGDIALANEQLQRIPDRSFAAAWKYDLYGDILAKSGQTDQAVRAYERSLEINSGNRSVLMKLMNFYRLSDPRKAQQINERMDYITSFYNVL